MTTVMESGMMLIVPGAGMHQKRISCGWKYNRTMLYNARVIVFEVTKCCDHCEHCVNHEVAVETALMLRSLEYSFATNASTLTRWVTVHRPDDRDPVDFLREATGLPIKPVFFEIRRATRQRLASIAFALVAISMVILAGWACWELGSQFFSWLFTWMEQ
jgi:hypothetical protein